MKETSIQIDRAKFAEIVEQTSGRIYRMLLHIIGNEQDAEDILQETYLKAYRSLSDFEARSDLKTWLYRIAVNEALSFARKKRPESVSLENNGDEENSTGEEMEIVDWCCLPEKELMSTETRRYLDLAIQKLPVNLRLVFIMRDLEDLSIQETARLLEISENNVKVRLLRARLFLRQELSKYFGERMKEEKVV